MDVGDDYDSSDEEEEERVADLDLSAACSDGEIASSRRPVSSLVFSNGASTAGFAMTRLLVAARTNDD
ncbi:unnamed protein product [Linum trigynum]|uniref:Uncharacterized protein n=1 Tax=Linum trigynum TaxID=586398 RepID=A0AAV2D8E5_9ROSI